MSLLYWYGVSCDICYVEVDSDGGGDTPQKATDLSTKHGWHRVRGWDHCPECWQHVLEHQAFMAKQATP